MDYHWIHRCGSNILGNIGSNSVPGLCKSKNNNLSYYTFQLNRGNNNYYNGKEKYVEGFLPVLPADLEVAVMIGFQFVVALPSFVLAANSDLQELLCKSCGSVPFAHIYCT